MQGGVRNVCRSSALLAVMAFGVTWQMTSGFDDYFARSVIAISFLYVLIARFQVDFFADGIAGALRFAAVIWIALAAPVAIEEAIYVRMHSMVVVGQVID